ncbi:hypothetical protein MDOR_09450 [Mycolicibacterium doricum]|uniref:Uncharacterized protein n=1 Tax=Mycolicibacterium doricum TaxID=126673 RepID=A0A7I7VNC3_9MYCO|nr:hypothetical protein MDOR_09450 [Mycolicibacterium doricum]
MSAVDALSNHNPGPSEHSPGRETMACNRPACCGLDSPRPYGGTPMAKRGRKKRDRKNTKANHGKRPNAGSKSVR